MNKLEDTMKKCLLSEAEALLKIAESVDETSIDFAGTIAACKGKIVFTGVGKSFIVSSKIAGTLSSIGISSIALNPLSLLHGDMGFLDSEDIVIALSNSGETDILIDALKCIRSLDIDILSITGNKCSTIAGMSSVTVEVKTTESGPFGLVPTTSTTAMMAYGDALACMIAELLDLKKDAFYKNHPGNFATRL